MRLLLRNNVKSPGVMEVPGVSPVRVRVEDIVSGGGGVQPLGGGSTRLVLATCEVVKRSEMLIVSDILVFVAFSNSERGKNSGLPLVNLFFLPP